MSNVSLPTFAWAQLKGCADILIAAIQNIPNVDVSPEDVLNVWEQEVDGAAAIIARRKKALEALAKETAALELLAGQTIVDGMAALKEFRTTEKDRAASTIATEKVTLGVLVNRSGSITDDEKAAGLQLFAAVENYLGIEKAAKESAGIKINAAGGLSHKDARKVLDGAGWTGKQSGADITKKEYNILGPLNPDAYKKAREIAG